MIDYSKLYPTMNPQVIPKDERIGTPKDWGKRKDASTKGLGYFGALKRPDGGISTELSLGVNIGGKDIEIPSLVPTLTKDEIDYLLAGNKPTEDIVQKAIRHARERLNHGKSPFADEGEQGIYPGVQR